MKKWKRHRLLAVSLAVLLLVGLGGTAAAFCMPDGRHSYCDQISGHHTSVCTGQPAGSAWSCGTGECEDRACPVHGADCAFGRGDHGHSCGRTHHAAPHHRDAHHH